MRLHRFLIATLLLAAAFAASASPAREDDRERRDAVRRAMEAGEVLPLSEILTRVRGQLAGDISDVEIESEHGRWRYELRVIDRAGRVLAIKVNAQSGKIERIEEK